MVYVCLLVVVCSDKVPHIPFTSSKILPKSKPCKEPAL